MIEVTYEYVDGLAAMKSTKDSLIDSVWKIASSDIRHDPTGGVIADEKQLEDDSSGITATKDSLIDSVWKIASSDIRHDPTGGVIAVESPVDARSSRLMAIIEEARVKISELEVDTA